MLPNLKEWMIKIVLPTYTSLFPGNPHKDDVPGDDLLIQPTESIHGALTTILQKAIENPEKVGISYLGNTIM